MAKRINDDLILSLKKQQVPQGKSYIVVYDDKDAGFIVRKSLNGVITYAIEFKDTSNNRKTIKIGNSKMKPAVARCVANSLLKQKLKDRRLRTLNSEDLLEVTVNEEPVGIVEKDVVDIASSFFDNTTQNKIVKTQVDEVPENIEVTIENSEEESIEIDDVIETEDDLHYKEINNKNFIEESSDNFVEIDNEESKEERIFKEQLDPVSEAMFITQGIGSKNDEAFRLDFFGKVEESKLKGIANAYRDEFTKAIDLFPKHQSGRAVTQANKYLLSLKSKDKSVNKKATVISLSDKIKKKEDIIRDRG